MIDSDSVTILVLLIVVVLLLLSPPGPGTPLRSPAAAWKWRGARIGLRSEW